MVQQKITSYKDVQISYLTGGLEVVQQLFEKELMSTASLRKAVKSFLEKGTDATDLETWVASLGGARRGRGAPRANEVRHYKAQRINDGGAFLRLPIISLGSAKGDTLRVRFEENEIVVSPLTDEEALASLIEKIEIENDQRNH